MKVRIKKLTDRAIIPTYGSVGSAGGDLYSAEEKDVLIAPNQTVLIGTGLAVEIPDGYVGLVYARSGLATKSGLAPANKVGVIDSDYRGEVKVALHNHGTQAQIIRHAERIAQMVITPVLTPAYVEAAELDDTQRGIGGFGSTGTN